MAIETKCRTLTGKISQISLALSVKSVTVTFIKNEKNIFCIRKRQKELYRIFSKFIIELQSKHQKFYKTTFFRRENYVVLYSHQILFIFLYFSSQSLQRTWKRTTIFCLFWRVWYLVAFKMSKSFNVDLVICTHKKLVSFELMSNCSTDQRHVVWQNVFFTHKDPQHSVYLKKVLQQQRIV